MPVFLSIDLGAGSGRVIAGVSDLKTLKLEEIHRFDNPGTDLPGGSFWNIVGLFRDIMEGLRRGVEKYGKDIVAIGIDTWGCDFGLLDNHGRLLGLPFRNWGSRRHRHALPRIGAAPEDALSQRPSRSGSREGDVYLGFRRDRDCSAGRRGRVLDLRA